MSSINLIILLPRFFANASPAGIKIPKLEHFLILKYRLLFEVSNYE